jgi:uncharacterized protein YndB with AHSA1/START domain
MQAPAVHHAIFVVDRTLRASPAAVFRAWSDPEARARWLALPQGWMLSDAASDFRQGGPERMTCIPVGGPAHELVATWQEIVPDERIVVSYGVTIDGHPASASVATIELKPAGSGTRVVYTEQGAFLAGRDTMLARQRAVTAAMDALAREVDRPEPAA